MTRRNCDYSVTSNSLLGLPGSQHETSTSPIKIHNSWKAYVHCFLVTTAFILSFESCLDCNFIELHLPAQEVAVNNNGRVHLDSSKIGIGLFSYEVIRSSGVAESYIDIDAVLHNINCIGYMSSMRLMVNGGAEDTDMGELYGAFQNGDDVFEIARFSSALSILALCTAVIVTWCIINTSQVVEYGPRREAYNTKMARQKTCRTIGYMLLLSLCMIAEGNKLQFLNIGLCQPPPDMEAYWYCSVSRGMTLSITALSCLSISMLMAIVC